MNVEDLTTHRIVRSMKELEEARTAQANLQTERQLQLARVVLQRISEPRSETERIEVVDALEFATDALCNKRCTAEARQLASEKLELMHELDDGPGKLINRPKSLAGYRARRVHAATIELDGDPDDAMRRLTALYKLLARDAALGPVAVDAILVLRAILSAAKRDGGRVARQFADFARLEGDRLVGEVAIWHPKAACTYLHRAALERRSRTGGAARDEALVLLNRSLLLRSNTVRDLKSRGMAQGEVVILEGERDRGAQILTETVRGFEGVLDRHYESARRQLIERNLLLAA
jgi:hypothetical protein